MGNRRKYSLYLAFAALLLASLACQAMQGSEPTSAPEDSSASEQTNPVVPGLEPAATSDAPAQTGGKYDGSWTGTNTVDDKEILFKVEDNQVTSIALNYTGEASGCTYHGALSTGSSTGGMDAVTIENDGFSTVVESVNDELTFTGTFTADGEANGTLHIKSSASGLCGEYEKEIAWTATKDAGSEAEEASEDTASSSESNGDVAALVTSFFDAVNAGDVGSAISMVDENIMFTVGTTITKFSSSELESYLQSTEGVTYEITNAQSMAGGTMVQFKAKASDGTAYSYCQAFVQDGKITMMSLMP
jgi:hypothetical protein